MGPIFHCPPTWNHDLQNKYVSKDDGYAFIPFIFILHLLSNSQKDVQSRVVT